MLGDVMKVSDCRVRSLRKTTSEAQTFVDSIRRITACPCYSFRRKWSSSP